MTEETLQTIRRGIRRGVLGVLPEDVDELERLARLGAAVEAMPQGVSLARHGALGATRWCVTNTDDEHDSVDGDDAFDALQNADQMGFLDRFRNIK